MTTDLWRGFVQRCADAERVVLAAPYIKLDSLSMTLEVMGSGTTLECYTRWSVLDIQIGASDIACRTLVKSQGGVFRLHNRLHAKYYRADDHMLIGSANLTRSGLGISDSPNLEILTQPTASFDWVGFERRLLRESRMVSDDEFALWEQCPVPEVKPRDDCFPVMELGNWKPQTRHPDYLWLLYSGESLPSDEQHDLATADLAALGVPGDLDQETFEEWVGTALAAAPFVGFIIERIDAADELELWDAICSEWGAADRAAASRLVETVQIWVRRYNPIALTVDVQGPCPPI